MNYRQWRKDYDITGEGSRGHCTLKKLPSSATVKQEWNVLRLLFAPFARIFGRRRAASIEKTICDLRFLCLSW
jgi:hypothetical protein